MKIYTVNKKTSVHLEYKFERRFFVFLDKLIRLIQKRW